MVGEDLEILVSPAFDEQGFLNRSEIVGQGWLATNFFAPSSYPDKNELVLLAVLAPTNDLNGGAGVISGSFTLGWFGADGAHLKPVSFMTILAPGALVLRFAATLIRGTCRRRGK